ncbi:hypothetical protein DPMN_035157 [Dreissena polymorpha]|uniref:Uncharacterized protein n=1 Tax=Dreissena polymorpha TaxID=45954 RepID=A0A9D4M6S3_DREPO|nr:hypothetical protein DPMN_035157 [Dreissena polymorpha]
MRFANRAVRNTECWTLVGMMMDTALASWAEERCVQPSVLFQWCPFLRKDHLFAQEAAHLLQICSGYTVEVFFVA